MRICAVCTGFASWYGGAEIALNYLSQYWVKQGHEVYILCGWGSKSAPKGVNILKIPFISRKYFDKISLLKRFLFFLPTFELESFSTLPFLLPYLRKVSPDIVLTITLSETVASLLLGFPTIMISQAGTWYRFKLYEKADVIIVNEPLSLRRLEKFGSKVKCILNGTEIKKLPAIYLKKIISKYNIPDNKEIKILSVARLDSQKKIHLLIKAFKLIKEKCILIIVGEGPELPKLLEFCKSFQDKVTFLGGIPHEEVLALYQICNVFSLPSLGEACSLALIEAICSGIRVVTNPEPTKKFILNDYGVFVDVEDSSKYSQALLYAATHRLDTSSNTFRRYINKFSWKKIAEEYVAIFENLLKSKNIKRRSNASK
jgi:glycosyltransferase involved in cell wall biosynthesis